MLTGKHPFYHRNLYRLQQNILHRTPHFDPALSPEARSLLHGLLAKDPAVRLGRVSPRLDHNGVMVAEGDVEGHPFFVKHRVNWVTVESRQGVPGWVPELRDEKDVSHFDAQFTGQTPSDTPESFSERQLDEQLARKTPGGGGGGGGGGAAGQVPGGGLSGGLGKGESTAPRPVVAGGRPTAQTDGAATGGGSGSASPALQGNYALYAPQRPLNGGRQPRPFGVVPVPHPSAQRADVLLQTRRRRLRRPSHPSAAVLRRRHWLGPR